MAITHLNLRKRSNAKVETFIADGKNKHAGSCHTELTGETSAAGTGWLNYRQGYKLGAIITWLVIFLGSWIYCITNYGFLVGGGLGWIPAAITATVMCLFWPFCIFGGVLFWLLLVSLK